jgi:mannose-6-phosphate isomerase-like protein (cupin superfamily)
MRPLHLNIPVVAVILSAAILPTAAEPSMPPPAPPPGSPATYVTRQQLTDQMKAAVRMPSGPASSPIGVSDQYSIQEVRRGAAGAPAIHHGWTELHFILEGSGTFVTGNTITSETEGNKSLIEGGVSRQVQKGDAIIVPADTPHWYKTINGSLTYLEVRFVAPGAAPAPK